MVKAFVIVDGVIIKEYSNKKRKVLYGIAMREFKRLANKNLNVCIMYDHSEEVR